MSIFDILKSAGETLRKADKIEEYQKILDAQKELLEMQKKITDLEEGNKSLKEKLKTKENLIPENNVYWIKREDGNKDGPFCTRCWDKDKDLIRMRYYSTQQWSKAHYDCPECKNTYLA